MTEDSNLYIPSQEEFCKGFEAYNQKDRLRIFRGTGDCDDELGRRRTNGKRCSKADPVVEPILCEL